MVRVVLGLKCKFPQLSRLRVQILSLVWHQTFRAMLTCQAASETSDEVIKATQAHQTDSAHVCLRWGTGYTAPGILIPGLSVEDSVASLVFTGKPLDRTGSRQDVYMARLKADLDRRPPCGGYNEENIAPAVLKTGSRSNRCLRGASSPTACTTQETHPHIHMIPAGKCRRHNVKLQHRSLEPSQSFPAFRALITPFAPD